MRVTMRLYKMHDLDLIALYQNKSFHFTKAVYSCLSSLVRGHPFWIEEPEFCVDFEHTSKIIQIALIIPDNDKEVINLLHNVKRGIRNSYIKNLMRSFILRPNLNVYYEKEIQEPSSLTDREYREFPRRNQGKKRKEKTESIETMLKNQEKKRKEEIEDFDAYQNEDSSHEKPPEKKSKEPEQKKQEFVEPDNENSDDNDEFDLFDSFMNIMKE